LRLCSSSSGSSSGSSSSGNSSSGNGIRTDSYSSSYGISQLIMVLSFSFCSIFLRFVLYEVGAVYFICSIPSLEMLIVNVMIFGDYFCGQFALSSPICLTVWMQDFIYMITEFVEKKK
jgi:hypothetical protein